MVIFHSVYSYICYHLSNNYHLQITLSLIGPLLGRKFDFVAKQLLRSLYFQH